MANEVGRCKEIVAILQKLIETVWVKHSCEQAL